MDAQLSSSAVNSGNVVNLNGTEISVELNRNTDSPIYAGYTTTSDAISEVNLGTRENPAISIEGNLNVDETGTNKPSISKLKSFWKTTNDVYIKDDVFYSSFTKVAIDSIKFNRTAQWQQDTKGNFIPFTITAIESK